MTRPRATTPPLDADEGRRLLLAGVSEDAFQRQVEAQLTGWNWLLYHTRFSWKSQAGFPDLVAVRPPRVVFVELKRFGGKLSASQERWRDALRACPTVEWHCFTPEDWETIGRVFGPDPR